LTTGFCGDEAAGYEVNTMHMHCPSICQNLQRPSTGKVLATAVIYTSRFKATLHGQAGPLTDTARQGKRPNKRRRNRA